MDLLANLTIAQWAALSPAISYWTVASSYEVTVILDLFPQYRVLPSEEERKKNTVSKGDVVRYMLMYHVVSSTLLLLTANGPPTLVQGTTAFGTLPRFRASLIHTVGIQNDVLLAGVSWTLRASFLALKQLIALVVLDTYNFWGHYTLHKVPWLYRMSSSQKIPAS